MEFKKYQKLAKLIKEARNIIFEFESHQHTKNSAINQHHKRAIKRIDQARSSLENMMFKEHPDQAQTDIFYE